MIFCPDKAELLKAGGIAVGGLLDFIKEAFSMRNNFLKSENPKNKMPLNERH